MTPKPALSRFGEPRGLLIGGIAAGVAGVMADLLSPIYATSFHKGFGLTNTEAGFLVTAALGMMAVSEFGLAHSIGHRNLKHVTTWGSRCRVSRCSTSARSATTASGRCSSVWRCWGWAAA